MRSFPLFVCLLAYSPMLIGQTAASLEGKVVNAISGAPIRNATVVLRLQRAVSTASAGPAQAVADPLHTDETGYFKVSNLPPGGYQITAEHPGFLRSDTHQRLGMPDLIMLGKDQQLTGVLLRLEPHAVVTGKVLDSDGEPVMGAQVTALQWSYFNGQRRLVSASMNRGSVSNDLGEYRIAGLAAGNYFIMVGLQPLSGFISPGGELRMHEGPELAAVTTYYPSTAELANATAVTVRAGVEVHGIDIRMVKVKTWSIRGRIIDSGGDPNRPPMISLMGRNTPVRSWIGNIGSVMTSNEGSFRISGVPPGSYDLSVQRRDDRGRVTAGSISPVEVGEKNVDGLEIHMQPTLHIDAILRSDARSRCEYAYLSLVNHAGYFGTPGVPLSLGSKATIPDIAPADYTLNVSNSQCYVQSVRYDGREIVDMHLTIDHSAPLEISVTPSDAMVQGTVIDSAGNPVASAVVTLLSTDRRTGNFPSAVTGRDGSFTTSGVPPGTYQVFAWEAIDYQSAQSPDYTKQFASRAQTVAVQPGSHQTVQLTLIPASATGLPFPPRPLPRASGSVEGRVVNAATGAPIAGATVVVGRQSGMVSGAGPRLGTGSSGMRNDPTAETDEQGRFSITGIQPEVYYLSANRRGFSMSAGIQPFVVGNGQHIAGYSISLAPEGVITGTVADEFGEAVRNLQAVLYRAVYRYGTRRFMRMAMAQTDDLGKFRLSGLAPGSYYLAMMRWPQGRITPPPSEAAGSEASVAFGMLWYPNAATVADATPITVGAAAEVPVQVVMRRTKVMRIRGTVISEEGEIARPPMIALTPRGMPMGTMVGSLILHRGGEFEITGVPAGSYLLSARVPEEGAASQPGPSTPMAYLPVEVRDTNIEDVQLHIRPGKQVHGTMQWEGVEPHYGSITANAAEGPTTWARVSPDGAFTFPSIWPLTYSLDVNSLCRDCYVKSMRYSGRDVPESGIEFDGDGELQIVVGADAASLDGVALDTQTRPVAGAVVVLMPADSARHFLRIQADDRGAFHFGGLRPGAYRVLASQSALPEISPEALAPLQAQAVALTLKPHAQERLQLPVVHR
jgi:protocatechuate 3,4-dioxygenase beta subunit